MQSRPSRRFAAPNVSTTEATHGTTSIHSHHYNVAPTRHLPTNFPRIAKNLRDKISVGMSRRFARKTRKSDIHCIDKRLIAWHHGTSQSFCSIGISGELRRKLILGARVGGCSFSRHERKRVLLVWTSRRRAAGTSLALFQTVDHRRMECRWRFLVARRREGPRRRISFAGFGSREAW